MTNKFEQMFETFNKLGYPTMGPTADEYKLQLENAKRESKVKFKKYESKLYVLSDKDQNDEYKKDMFDLVVGVSNQTHVIFKQDKQFITTKDNLPTWLVSLEWGEFELIDRLIAPVTSTKEKEDDKAIREINEIRPTDPISA